MRKGTATATAATATTVLTKTCAGDAIRRAATPPPPPPPNSERTFIPTTKQPPPQSTSTTQEEETMTDEENPTALLFQRGGGGSSSSSRSKTTKGDVAAATTTATATTTKQSSLDTAVDNNHSHHEEKEKEADDASVTSNTSTNMKQSKFTQRVIIIMILLLGFVACAAFLEVGIDSAKEDQLDQFRHRAQELVNQLQRAWIDYEVAASTIHGRCRNRNFTRADFRQLYDYLIGTGLEFQAAQFDPNLTHAERPLAEAELQQWLTTYYPNVTSPNRTANYYRGFVGFNNDTSTVLEPRHNASFYFPIHYMEPIKGNERALHLDYHASGSRKRTVEYCMTYGQPALTDRLRLVQETTASAYGVVLMHPGYNLSSTTSSGISGSQPDLWPRDLASIVIRIPDLIRRAAQTQGESSVVYIYNQPLEADGTAVFLGGAQIVVTAANKDDTNQQLQQLREPEYHYHDPTLTFLPEIELDDLLDYLTEESSSYLTTTKHNVRYHRDSVTAANKHWIIVIHSLPGTYRPDLNFVLLGGIFIFLASGCLACWIRNNTMRVEQFNAMKAATDQEKASFILDNARKATKAERDLNDFIAHEVRNRTLRCRL
jgi:hypothetical protein